jgi:hypothetical protein
MNGSSRPRATAARRDVPAPWPPATPDDPTPRTPFDGRPNAGFEEVARREIPGPFGAPARKDDAPA